MDNRRKIPGRWRPDPAAMTTPAMLKIITIKTDRSEKSKISILDIQNADFSDSDRVLCIVMHRICIILHSPNLFRRTLLPSNAI